VQHAGNTEARGTVEVVLDVVDHDARAGCHPEALTGDGVDAPRRLAHADIGGDDDDIGQRQLVMPSGGRATAAAIPGARLVIVPGMAHHLPPALWPCVIDEIAANTSRTTEPATMA
jgi:pimeloyl-ACP methyl ester carboxylesterase